MPLPGGLGHRSRTGLSECAHRRPCHDAHELGCSPQEPIQPLSSFVRDEPCSEAFLLSCDSGRTVVGVARSFHFGRPDPAPLYTDLLPAPQDFFITRSSSSQSPIGTGATDSRAFFRHLCALRRFFAGFPQSAVARYPPRTGSAQSRRSMSPEGRPSPRSPSPSAARAHGAQQGRAASQALVGVTSIASTAGRPPAEIWARSASA